MLSAVSRIAHPLPDVRAVRRRSRGAVWGVTRPAHLSHDPLTHTPAAGPDADRAALLQELHLPRPHRGERSGGESIGDGEFPRDLSGGDLRGVAANRSAETGRPAMAGTAGSAMAGADLSSVMTSSVRATGSSSPPIRSWPSLFGTAGLVVARPRDQAFLAWGG